MTFKRGSGDKTYQCCSFRVIRVLLKSNAADYEEEDGHSGATNHQHGASADLINQEPSSDEADKTSHVAQDVEQESLALVALGLVEDDRVLAGKGLTGNLLAEHGNDSNHGSLSVVHVEYLRPGALLLGRVSMTQDVNLLLDFGLGVVLVQSSQGHLCFFDLALREEPVIWNLLVWPWVHVIGDLMYCSPSWRFGDKRQQAHDESRGNELQTDGDLPALVTRDVLSAKGHERSNQLAEDNHQLQRGGHHTTQNLW